MLCTVRNIKYDCGAEVDKIMKHLSISNYPRVLKPSQLHAKKKLLGVHVDE